RRRCTGFANVIAGDRYRVPEWHMLGGPREIIDYETQRGLDGVNPRVLRHVLLEDVVLDSSAQFLDVHTLLLGGGNVEREQNYRRTIDGHRRRNLVERNPFEKRFHVGETGYRDAALADLALGTRVIGVIAHQRRKIER